MSELHGLRVRRKSRTRVTLAWTGAVLFVSSFGLWGLAMWLALPRWFALVVATVFVLGVSLELGLGLSTTTGVKRIELSRAQVDQLKMWMQSGEIVTRLEGLSQGQLKRLDQLTSKLSGRNSLKEWTDEYGNKWLTVGMKVKFARYDHDQPAFNVVLYRRDLAAKRGMRRPWRSALRDEFGTQFDARGKEVELPSWIGQ
jgi:hypothetical protein